MKHNSIKYSLGALVLAGSLALTGCIKETFPSGAATSEQVARDPMALEKIVNSLTNYTIKTNTYGSSDYTDGGMPGWMFARDVMCEDFPVSELGKDWDWFNLIARGEGTEWGRLPYYYFYTVINKANDMLMSIDLDNVPESTRTMVGNLLGYRAMSYFELARMFEFQPTGYAELDEKAESDGIIGLTVPIIEARAYTLAELIKNPRAPFYKMYRFIWNDLCLAEELLAGYRRPTVSSMEKVSLMNEYVIHGLKARFWLELATRFNRSAGDLAAQVAAEGSADGCRDLGITSAADCYKNAIAEADKVINEGGFSPTTMEQWYDIETGFFKPTQAWVWGSCITSTEENPGRWYSHIGWISTEADWGWTNSDFKCYRCIGSSLYDKISWDDWRKATWIDPYYAGYGDEVKENYEIQQTAEYAASYPAYSNLKFRVPHLTDYKSGLTCCTPFMRVEEMILLRAEALYYTEGADAAKSALESFVNTYRYLDEPEDGAYTCDASTESNFISALMLQRRIEFWGEGIVFYDYKRLRLPVQRSLSSNFPDTYTLDTKNGYVAPWMNCYLSAYAVSLKDSNFKGNPNFSGIVKPQ